ncbi:hypothetical protein NMY22_g12122 [Coprinellus aureogranulatus]|nr:hypothetical protein NMY22_g12122 [Coprinellus aureogranulatus]
MTELPNGNDIACCQDPSPNREALDPASESTVIRENDPTPTQDREAITNLRAENEAHSHAANVDAPVGDNTAVGSDDSSAPRPESGAEAPRNIVFFGETGVGKSAIVNMLLEFSGKQLNAGAATVSSAAEGCTASSTGYSCHMNGNTYVLWDTAGMVEGDFGHVTAKEAEERLAELLCKMPDGGISLLVYCIRGRRLRPIVKQHYDLFFQEICGGQIPLLLVVTGLENEVNMEDWWVRNEGDFIRHGIKVQGCACITSTRGKATKEGYMLDVEYSQSAARLGECIVKYGLPSNALAQASTSKAVSLRGRVPSMRSNFAVSGVSRAFAQEARVPPRAHTVTTPASPLQTSPSRFSFKSWGSKVDNWFAKTFDSDFPEVAEDGIGPGAHQLEVGDESGNSVYTHLQPQPHMGVSYIPGRIPGAYPESYESRRHPLFCL